MTTKIRISNKLNETFPAPVVQKIQAIGKDHGIKSFGMITVGENKTFYIGEGEGYTGITADGKTASFEVVSANNIGAAGLSHRIGSQFSMPAGTFLIRTSYYTKYFMDVYYIAPKMIA